MVDLLTLPSGKQGAALVLGQRTGIFRDSREKKLGGNSESMEEGGGG